MNPHQQIERLTATGRGAVAVIRLQTSNAAAMDLHFQAANGMSASTAAVGRILFGKWRDEELVVVRTADCEWEINCHGGEAAVGQIMSDLRRYISESPPCDMNMVDEVNSLLQQCRSRRTAEYLLAHSEGVMSQFLQALCDCVDSAAAKPLVAKCLKWQTFANHLLVPWNVTIVGQPNAGKSSLLNALVGYQRAIVFDQPGTTRDRIEAELLLDGWPMRVTDTAGIRETNDEIESSGVAATFSSLGECDLCLLVVDATTGWSEDDSSILRTLAPDIPVAVLLNKSDLTDAGSIDLPDPEQQFPTFRVSALTRHGLDDLLKWIPRTLVPEIPSLHQPLPFIARVAEALHRFVADDDLLRLKSTIQMWQKARSV